MNVVGPICKGRRIVPSTSLRVPSNPLTIMLLSSTSDLSMDKCSKVDSGRTFNADPPFINTLATMKPLHLRVICKALNWSVVERAISSSEKDMVQNALVMFIMLATFSGVVLDNTYALYRAFCSARRCGSKFKIKLRIEIFAGVLFSWSIML